MSSSFDETDDESSAPHGSSGSSSPSDGDGHDRRNYARRIPKIRVNATVQSGPSTIDGYVYDFSEVSVALFLSHPLVNGQTVKVTFDDASRKASFDMIVNRCEKNPSQGRVIKVNNHDYKAALLLATQDAAETKRFQDFILPTA